MDKSWIVASAILFFSPNIVVANSSSTHSQTPQGMIGMMSHMMGSGMRGTFFFGYWWFFNILLVILLIGLIVLVYFWIVKLNQEIKDKEKRKRDG